jgi:hypothetical protein
MIKSRRMRLARQVARIWETRNAYRVLIGKPEGKRLLGRPKHKLENNNKMDLREKGGGGMDWIHLGQIRTSDRLL